ncbi:MAG: putative membrane protein YdjX (TVP38/TMEM64 family), partial [Myxococcota bacterium]
MERQYSLPRVTVINTYMRNRLILLAAVLTIASLAHFGGLFQYLDPEHLRELLTDSGAWGPLLVIV